MPAGNDHARPAAPAREAVTKRAMAVSAHYQMNYPALYERFQMSRYTEILAKDFDAAIEFIRTIDLRVPAKRTLPDAKSEQLLAPDHTKRYTVTAFFLERQRVLVYYLRYLFREEIELIIKLMRLMNSPHAGMLWDAIHNINLAMLEKTSSPSAFPSETLTATSTGR